MSLDDVSFGNGQFRMLRAIKNLYPINNVEDIVVLLASIVFTPFFLYCHVRIENVEITHTVPLNMKVNNIYILQHILIHPISF